MKKYFLLCLLLLLIIPSVVSAQRPPYTIGVPLALTGDAAPFGTQELKGAQLAVAEIERDRGLKIILKVEDTQSTTLGTVTAVKRLLDIDGLRLFVGPTWLDSFQGTLPVVDRQEVLLITPSAGISNIKKSASDYPLVFSSFFNFEREITFLVEHLATVGAKRVAILFDQDPYFQAMRSFALEAAMRLKLEVVSDQDFSSGELDFRSVLIGLKPKNIDACIFGSTAQGSVLAFLKQRRELFPNLRVIGTHDFDGYGDNPSLVPLLSAIEYAVPAEASQTFRNAFKNRYGINPILSASNAYDAVMMIASAILAGHTAPPEIANFLRSSVFKTVSFGETKFTSLGGIETGDFKVKRW